MLPMGTPMADFSHRSMYEDIYQCDPSPQRLAAGFGMGCAGDYWHAGLMPGALPTSTDGDITRMEQGMKALVGRARRDARDHSRRIAAIAGEAECWARVAGVWFTGFIRRLSGNVAIFDYGIGELAVPYVELTFEKPCRWPV